MASVKPTTRLVSVFLATVSVAHLLRIVFGVQVTVADNLVPMWVSGVAFVVAGSAAIILWSEARNRA